MSIKLKNKLKSFIIMLLVVLAICTVELVDLYCNSKKLEKLKEESKYSTIIEFNNNSGCIQYDKNTKEVKIVYTSGNSKNKEYIRIDTDYIYEENTKNLIHSTN